MDSINVEKDISIHIENKELSREFFWFIWIMYAVVFMTKSCYNGAMASIVTEGALTKSQTGFITAMFYLVYTPLQVVGGFAADKYSPQRLIKIGLLGSAVANTIIFFNQNYYVMLAAWVFNGAVQFGIWPSVFKIVSSQLVRSDRTQMAFYISFSGTVGAMLSYFVAMIVPKWQYNFLISAVSLIIFAMLLTIYNKRLNPYMKRDITEAENEDNQKTKQKLSTMKIFAASGLFFMLISTILFTIVTQSRTSLASIMFVENYESVSASLGNLFNIILIMAGVAGTLIARKFCNKSKNEVAGMLITLIAEIPLLVLCMLIGKASVLSMLLVLCIISSLEAVVMLFRNYYNVYFAKSGKNGIVAGILNSGMALSYMVAAYVMPLIVEKFGWLTLIKLWPVLIAVAAVLLLFIIKCFKKFKMM